MSFLLHFAKPMTSRSKGSTSLIAGNRRRPSGIGDVGGLAGVLVVYAALDNAFAGPPVSFIVTVLGPAGETNGLANSRLLH